VNQRSPFEGLAKLDPKLFQPPSLESCEGKLRRADHHLQSLRDEIGPLEANDSHSFSVEHDADACEFIFKVHGIARTEPEWGYIAGDCIHNLRSTLDHLVYHLSLLGRGARRMTEREAKSCQFPIVSRPERFPEPGEGGIQFLRTGERTRIAELQPFNGSDMSIWGPDPEVAAPGRSEAANIPTLLAMLADLDNIDKHRLVNPTWHSARWHDTPEPPASFKQYSIRTASLHDGAEVGRWGYQGSDVVPESPTEADANRHFPVAIALGQPTFMYPMLDLLAWFTEAVGAVVDLFRPCFATLAPPSPVTDIDVPLVPHVEELKRRR